MNDFEPWTEERLGALVVKARMLGKRRIVFADEDPPMGNHDAAKIDGRGPAIAPAHSAYLPCDLAQMVEFINQKRLRLLKPVELLP